MIHFIKMQALGNDFVVINLLSQKINITEKLIRYLADRHLGIGCDQVLLLTKTNNPKADFGYRIFNADGCEVFQCGNGARCMGVLIRKQKLSAKNEIILETGAGLLRIKYMDEDEVQVDIAIPDFSPASLPFLPEKNTLSRTFDVVSVGNPHGVIACDDISLDEINKIGAEFNQHPAFPKGVNLGFVKYLSRDRIELCVYERGVGITHACGSGACAAVAVGRKKGKLDATVNVVQAGGSVFVHWDKIDDPIQLRGSGEIVFFGEIKNPPPSEAQH